LSGQSTPAGIWVAIGVSLAALIFSMAVFTEVATMNTVQVPADLTQRLNGIESKLNALPAVNQTVTVRQLKVEWTIDAFGHDRFYPGVLVVNQGDTVDLTFVSNDTEDGHTFTLMDPVGYNFQINLTAPGLLNTLNGLNFTTAPTNNSPGVTVTGDIGSLTGEGTFVAKTPGIYQFICIYHDTMVGYFLVLPNLAYTQGP